MDYLPSGTDGLAANAAKFTFVNTGLCNKAKQRGAILERLHEEMYSNQFDILDALMNLAGGFIQQEAAKELGKSCK